MERDKKYVVNKLRDYAIIDRDIANIRFRLRLIKDKLMRRETDELYALQFKLRQELINKCVEKEYIDSALNMLTIEERGLLVELYVDNQSITTVCAKRMYSPRQLHRIKNKAIQHLQDLLI